MNYQTEMGGINSRAQTKTDKICACEKKIIYAMCYHKKKKQFN